MCNNPTLFYFDDMINISDFDDDNVYQRKKSYESVLNYHDAYKTPYGVKALRITFDKDVYIRKYDLRNIQHYLLAVKNMRQLWIELDIIIDILLHILQSQISYYLKNNIWTFILINI